MFWGLVLEPSKKYTQKVEQSFHISQATLELKSADLEPVQVILEFQGSNFILATLSKKHNIFQVPLDLNFEAGDQISFRTIGKARVHLTGYHVIEDDDALEGLLQGENDVSDDEDEEEEESSFNDTATPGKRKKALTKSNEKKKKKLDTSNEDEDENDDDDDETDSEEESFRGLRDTTMGDSTLFEDDDDSDEMDDSEDIDEEEDDDDDDDLEEEEEESDEDVAPTPKSEKKKANQSLNASVNGISSSKKDKKNKFKAESGSPKTPSKDGLSPKKEKQGKTPKQEGSQKKTPKSEKGVKQEPKTPNTPNSPGTKRVLEGGVVIEELKVGEGQVAKPGKMAQVYYSGRLKSNNKLFDSAMQGPGFKFRLGKGEVIKGWDIGVNGMKVGGKRKITIPSNLAYGAKGSPPTIPPNSTLVFEVELRGVN